MSSRQSITKACKAIFSAIALTRPPVSGLSACHPIYGVLLLTLLLGLNGCAQLTQQSLKNAAETNPNSPITDTTDHAKTAVSVPYNLDVYAIYHEDPDFSIIPANNESTYLSLTRALTRGTQQDTLTDTVASAPDTDKNTETITSSITPAAIATDVVTIDSVSPHTQAIINTPNNSALWVRLRDGFAMTDNDQRRTNNEAQWYARHPEYIARTLKRAEPYLHLIIEEVERRNMPLELALLPIVESAFQPFAYSHGRAAGIWQFIPATAKRYGLKQNWWYDGRRDIPAATHAALDFLQDLSKRFDGDWSLALAAYNSGEGKVARAIKKNRRAGKPTDFWSLKLPKETQAYVPKLLGISRIFANPDQYNITLPIIENKAYIEKVEIGSQLDLALAAELASISVDDIYRLNAGYNRWATNPDGPHVLYLPIDKAADFSLKLANLPASKRSQWRRHTIKDGETLGHIAKKYRTTVSVLRKANKIKGQFIRAGKGLMIPVAAKNLDHYALSKDQRTNSLQAIKRKGRKHTHIVSAGDTLWDISRAYNVSYKRLARWNGIAPRDLLRPGQKLVIWKESKKKTQTAGLTPPRHRQSIQKIRYTVRNGDSLARISQKFKVTINKLKDWNPKARGKYIQPGQRLTLFVDVTRQSENI